MDLLSQDDLMRRRERLLLRSAQLRTEWAMQVEVLRAPLGVANQASAATRAELQRDQAGLRD